MSQTDWQRLQNVALCCCRSGTRGCWGLSMLSQARFTSCEERFEHFTGLDVTVAVRPAHIGRDGVNDDQPDVTDFICLRLKQIHVDLQTERLAPRAIRLRR